MTKVRVLIVDDQAPFRDAAAAVVAFTDPFELAGAVATGEQCLSAVQELTPDLGRLDISLPGMAAIEAARLVAGLPRPPVVVLVSTYARHEYAERAAHCGAAAYIDKSAFGPERLLAVWAAVHSAGSTASRTVPDVETPQASGSAGRGVEPCSRS